MKPLGRTGPETSRLGLGCMAMSNAYGPADEDRSVDTIHHAIERGVNLIDTGDFYGMGHNEMLVSRALKRIGRGARDSLVVSVKFGALRGPDGAFLGVDGRPSSVKAFCAYSLARLRIDHIDIYRPARLDPDVPIEETAGAVAELIEAGYVRHLGLSEVGPETIRRAHAVTPVCDLQIEYSLMSRGVEDAILPTLRDLGIGMTAYGVLSRGLIADEPRDGGPMKGRMPRFSDENYEHNRQLVSRLKEVAATHRLTTSQLAFAWVAAQGSRHGVTIVPLIGTTRAERVDEALAALDVGLTEADLDAIAEALPASEVAGTRYDAHQMQMLDSERS